MFELSPAIPLFAGAVLAGVARGPARALVMLIAPMLGAYGISQFEPGITSQFEWLGNTLTPIRVDGLAVLFGYLFHLAAFIGVVYALHLKDPLQDVAALACPAVSEKRTASASPERSLVARVPLRLHLGQSGCRHRVVLAARLDRREGRRLAHIL